MLTIGHTHWLISPNELSDFNLHGQTHEGVLVPESISQINSVTHQKDSHKDRQLSGQNQNGHLRLPQEEVADVY